MFLCLHALEGTMNAESYIKVLEHMLPSRRRAFQQDNAKPNCSYYNSMAS